MRMHDMLMTETPRPFLGDEPHTMYARDMEKATVIEATQVARLMMEMTSFGDEVREDFEDFGGDTHAWQMAQSFNFDFTALSNIAPPAPEVLVEFDVREAVEQMLKADGKTYDPRRLVNVGKTAVQMLYRPAEAFEDVLRSYQSTNDDFPEIARIARDPDLGWVLYCASFQYVPGQGLVGPMARWFIPVKRDGSPYLQVRDRGDRLNHGPGLWAIMVPCEDRDALDAAENVAGRAAAAQGWQSLIPALMTVNLMHTPSGPNGYHVRTEEQPNARLSRKHLAKHFRPLTSWHMLDISPLREAVREASGGTMPTTMAGLVKALHIVRGHYAHYPPNTYFGRKHDEWVTVFRPSYRRGDIKAGRVDKDYRVGAE